MADTATRAFELVTRLEGVQPRSAADLADELGVTTRTIRRDIARLRDLGYPIDTVRGNEGGYRLEPGATLPPLILTARDAVACAIALAHHPAALDGVDTAAALTKIRSALPRRVAAAADAILAVSRRVAVDDALRPAAAPVNAGILADLASAGTERRRLRFDYAGRERQGARTVDPLALAVAAGRWYLVALDIDVRDWRTMRVDRISSLTVTDTPAGEHGTPAVDLDTWVTEQVGRGWQRVTALVRAHAPADVVRPFIASGWGTVEAQADGTCLLRVGADSHASIARWLMLVDADLTVIEPEPLRHEFTRLAHRALATSTRSQAQPPSAQHRHPPS